MPSNKQNAKLSVVKNPELAQLFTSDEDPENLFTDQREIGHGSFGAVYYARNNLTNEIVAIKKMNFAGKQSTEKWQDILKEVKFLKDTKHENCIHYKGGYLKELTCWLVMEYCLGSASDIVEVHKHPLKEGEIAAIIYGALCGLSYLHGHNRIHRDIKAGNILLTEKGVVKLADFGSASARSPCNSFVGTPFWMAPEVILAMDEGTYNYKIDIWSIGITCIELAERKPPLFHMNAMSALYHIAQNDPPRLQRPENWSDLFLDFISTCLKKEPEDRPTSQDLLQHTFLSGMGHLEILYQLVHRTQEAVRLMDNQSFKRLQKMLMHEASSIEEDEKEEIEPELPSDAGVDECTPSPSISPSSSEDIRVDPLLQEAANQHRQPRQKKRSNERGLVNHVLNQQHGPLPRVEEGGATGKEVTGAKAPVVRTQSARPAVAPESAVEPMPAKSLTSEVASLGLEDSTASDPGQPHPWIGSPSTSSVQMPANSIAVTASPSRESRERAEEVARKVTGNQDGFSTLRSHRMVSKQAEEWQLQSELREQMQGYKRMRHQHKHQMQQLESKHKSELANHYRAQEKELEQLRITYEKELERLRSRNRTDLEQRIKQDASDERKFVKAQKESHESDMKQFVGHQKADYRATKNVFKKQLEEDTKLSNAQRKQMLDERKKELLVQQKANESEHRHILRNIAEHNKVEYRENALKERHSFEKDLLQLELNLMQTHKDSVQVTKRRHLASTIELLYNQLKSLHELRTEHLQRQHASEWDNQLSYTKKAERELRKKHLIELKEHPKSLRNKEQQIKKQYNDTVKIQTRQYKALQKQMVATLPAERKKEILKQSKEEQLRKIAMLATQYERTIADMAQQQTLRLDEAQEAEQTALRKQLQQEQDLLQRFQESKEEKLKMQHGREKAAMDTKVDASRKELEKTLFDESVVLQNKRLERQQALQKQHLKEVRDFSEENSNTSDTESMRQRGSLTSERSSVSLTVGGGASLT